MWRTPLWGELSFASIMWQQPMTRVQSVFMPFITIYPRVIALMWRANGWRLIAAAILALVGALSGPFQIWISAVVINQIVSVVQDGVTQASLAGVLAPLGGLVLVWVISQAAGSLSEGLGEIMGDRAWYAATAAYIEKACEFDLAFFDSGKYMGRLEFARGQTWRIFNWRGNCSSSSASLSPRSRCWA
jgi:hypothetical protein